MIKCLCCNGIGHFRDKGKPKSPWEFPEPCIVCNGTGELIDYTLPNQTLVMPIVKKKTPAPTAAPKVKWTPTEGEEVLFLDTESGNELRGMLLEIDGKNGTIQVGEDQYSELLTDLKPAPAEEAPAPTPKAKLGANKPAPVAAGKSRSLIGMLKKAELPPEMSFGFPEGNWDAIVVGARQEEEKGELIGYIDMVGVGDETVEGKKVSNRSILVNVDESEGPGMTYFKRDLLKLGVDLDSIDSDDDLEIALTQLGEEQPWIAVTAKKRKGDTEGRTNVYIDGMKENQEEKPETPTF